MTRLEPIVFSIMVAMVAIVFVREIWFRIDLWRHPKEIEMELHRLRMEANDPAGANSVDEDLGAIAAHRLHWNSALDRRETFDHVLGGLGVIWVSLAAALLAAS
jgi:hypothetical protein